MPGRSGIDEMKGSITRHTKSRARERKRTTFLKALRATLMAVLARQRARAWPARTLFEFRVLSFELHVLPRPSHLNDR
jgi:hypothetical protein